MRKMRTIDQAAAWAREADPNTALTRTAIRRLVLSGIIPHVAVGRKRLVALEDIEEYLEQGGVYSSVYAGGIRSEAFRHVSR